MVPSKLVSSYITYKNATKITHKNGTCEYSHKILYSMVMRGFVYTVQLRRKRLVYNYIL